MRWPRRLRALFRRRAVEREIDEELRFHVEMDAAERVRSGAPADEARREALVAFGGVERHREAGLDVRGIRPLEDLLQDVRYGVRALRRSPSFALIGALTLALGIGANTAIFSVVDGVLLRPLPYADPSSLVSVWDDSVHPEAQFVAVRSRTRSYEAVGAYQADVGFSLTGDGEPVRLRGARVSADVFPLLGVPPALGRSFRAEEERPGEDGVVILSDALFRTRYGGDATIVGRGIDVDGARRTVVGVMPPGFAFPSASAQLWVPVTPSQENMGAHWGSYYLRLVGRLRPGADAAAATAEVRALAAQLRLENPVWTPDATYGANATVVPLRDSVVGASRPMLLLLLGAVGLVLLVACANVANLALARGIGRDHELAVRGALGAGRARLVRQLLTESVLLAVVGGAAGLLLAVVGVGLLSAHIPAGTPRVEEIVVNTRVLVFTAAVALATGLLFGVAPALRATRPRLADALKQGARTAGQSGRERAFTSTLVAGEVALAVVLVTGAALLLQSFWRLRSVEPGFAAERVLTVRVSPPLLRYADADRQRAFYDEVVARVQALPQVRTASVADQVPFDGRDGLIAMWIDGYTTDANALDMVGMRGVAPGYFDALDVPVLRGRAFTRADRDGAVPVAIVDRAMAERFWPDGNAVGGRIRYPWGGDWISVVGVAADARDETLAEGDQPSFYVPFAQRPSADAMLVVASTAPGAALLDRIAAAVAEVDAEVPLSDARTLEDRIAGSVAGTRFTASLLLGFAVVALVLGAIGIYGVLSYAVGQRLREFGVRMALGASRGAVVRQVVAGGGVVAGAGIAIGLVLAFALTRLMRGLLFGIAPDDPLTFVVVPVLLGAVALAACWLPALRAARVEPMAVMRGD